MRNTSDQCITRFIQLINPLLFELTVNGVSLSRSSSLGLINDLPYNDQASPKDHATAAGIHAIQGAPAGFTTPFVGVLPIPYEKTLREESEDYRGGLALLARGPVTPDLAVNYDR